MKEVTEQNELRELMNQPYCILFFYTPFCRTCKIAERMLQVVIESKDLQEKVYVCNLNYFPSLAEDLKIQSVPALTIYREGSPGDILFAFESVIKVDTFLSNE
ncbi:thioredoxin family protein [Guptibacillus hwajinpoensis]|uniref:Thioredoxin-like negative regulator of GroEL n=1 Tax=Guptibacillus hwajinpoensis TaxID=208199 RepID=A0ABU0K7B4_9BACL|nr:thioredoxin family protein [Alkalihalobacillus hemicentroti]MDQ0484361.1 thioredoxin-like negative regulator of GroEL [Alkalihalobacillus hemicentroti]